MAHNHPGFAKVQSTIAHREGISKERAGAILAASTRKAGKKAREKNPRLNRVAKKGQHYDTATNTYR